MTERLRVLLVTGSLPPMRCGVGDYTAGLARALAATNAMDVAVLTSQLAGRNDAVTAPGFEVLEPVANWRLSSLKPALDAIRAWRPDVVHIQHPSQGYDGPLPLALGLAARWRLGLPVVLTLHEPVGVNAEVVLMAALIRSAREVIVVRPNFRELVNGKVMWTIAGKTLRLIPNATTLPRMVPTADRRRALRERFGAGSRSLVAYFGFLYPNRGVHQLFEIADPARHYLAIVGGKLDEAAAYHDEVAALAARERWRDSCTLTGFLPEEEAAEVLACADAVVLPFLLGGGSWNTSLHGAMLQGTFVVTTSRQASGYDAAQNVYYARPSDVIEMRQALARHMGTRQATPNVPTWDKVAAEHYDSYRKARGAGR